MATTVKRKVHQTKKDSTRSISYRLPDKILDEIETEARQKNISHNVLVKQILEKYVKWDRFSDKIGMVPVPRKILDSLGGELTDMDISKIIDGLIPLIKDTSMFIKGGYDLERCIETLEDYMRASGMKSDHRIEGDIHHFVVQHELGIKWSIFTEQLLKRVLNDFIDNEKMKFEATESTVICSVPLGADFDEHTY